MELAKVACIAPPISDEKLAEYRSLIDAVDAKSELRDALESVFKCVNEWWNIRESTERAEVVVTGTDLTRGPRVNLQKLDSDLQSSLWAHIPWMKEIEAFEKLFEEISNTSNKPLRDCAFHLSWHAKELCNDREPITTDRIVE